MAKNAPNIQFCGINDTEVLFAWGIKAEGYGDYTSADGLGMPIVLEHYEGELRLLVWSDINQEEPTHIISLEGAREDKRKD